MTALLVICNPLRTSFNHEIARRITTVLEKDHHTVVTVNLYTEIFDPVLHEAEILQRFSFDPNVQRYSRNLEEAHGVVIVHPDWWGQPPALLKGWVDRVFRPGIAFEYEGEEFMTRRPIPLLLGKKAQVFCTTDRDVTIEAHPLETIWRNHIFGFCGIEDVRFHLLWEVHKKKPSERLGWLDYAEGQITGWLDK